MAREAAAARATAGSSRRTSVCSDASSATLKSDSERTGTLRRLQQRIDDLSSVVAALDVNGPVVTIAQVLKAQMTFLSQNYDSVLSLLHFSVYYFNAISVLFSTRCHYQDHLAPLELILFLNISNVLVGEEDSA